jgi:hypothetical protein
MHAGYHNSLSVDLIPFASPHTLSSHWFVPFLLGTHVLLQSFLLNNSSWNILWIRPSCNSNLVCATKRKRKQCLLPQTRKTKSPLPRKAKTRSPRMQLRATVTQTYGLRALSRLSPSIYSSTRSTRLKLECKARTTRNCTPTASMARLQGRCSEASIRGSEV